MDTNDNRQGHGVVGEKMRRVGLQHLGLGFLACLLILFLISWCSLPAR